MRIDIRIAFFDFPDQIADGFALQRSNQIAAGQNSSDNAAPHGNAEGGGSEQKGNHRAIFAFAAMVDVSLRDSFDIADNKDKPKPRTIPAYLKHGVSGSVGADRRHFIAAGQDSSENFDKSSLLSVRDNSRYSERAGADCLSACIKLESSRNHI